MSAMYRDTKLLELARGRNCLVGLRGICTADDDTVVAAHSNQLRHGKGRGLKAEDCYTVWACSACHIFIDASQASRAERVAAWEAGWHRQKQEWKRIAEGTHSNPRSVNTCKAVLKYLEGKQ